MLQGRPRGGSTSGGPSQGLRFAVVWQDFLQVAVHHLCVERLADEAGARGHLTRGRVTPARGDHEGNVGPSSGGLIRAAGAERFVLDRLVLDDDAPLSSEVERVRAALERVRQLSH